MLAELPTTVGGKLNRSELPTLDAPNRNGDRPSVPPRDDAEARLAAALAEILGPHAGASVHDDFFNDLGVDSLQAALLISAPAGRPRHGHAYHSRPVRNPNPRRAGATPPGRGTGGLGPGPGTARRGGRPYLATAIQSAWLLLGLLVGAATAYAVGFHVLPFLVRGLGLLPFILLAPLLAFSASVASTPLAVALAVLVKRLLIGRYRPLRAPVWGSFYVRNWMVQQAVRLVPWRRLEGTVFQHAVLRALGARVGRRVHLARGVDLLQGGWDLLDLGDDVTVGRDASLRLVELDDGHVVVGPVTLENGSTLDVRAGVGGSTCLEENAYLTALSSLPRGGRVPRGERWDGVPAGHAGLASPRPALPSGECTLSPVAHGLALVLARGALGAALALPLQALVLALVWAYGLDAEGLLGWLFGTTPNLPVLLCVLALVTLAVPLTLALQAVALRVLGRVSAGVVSRWGWSYVRVWLKAGLVESAGNWLSGTLFWPAWRPTARGRSPRSLRCFRRDVQALFLHLLRRSRSTLYPASRRR